MLNKLRERRDNESGFTLIELLVVILIIGILAAIALPAFLGQQAKGQDSSAKSDARNSVSQMESCFTTDQSYANCSLAGGGLKVATGTTPAKGEVAIAAKDASTYTLTAKSESGNTFSIAKASNGTTSRTCEKVGDDAGGCKISGSGTTGTW